MIQSTKEACMALADEHCSPNPARLEKAETEKLAAVLYDWQVLEGRLEKTFRFGNFHETMAFANAVAWIALPRTITPTWRSATAAASWPGVRTLRAASRAMT